MKTLFFSAVIAFASLATSVANAQVIFDALDGDAVLTFSNGTNTPPVFATAGTSATLTRPDVGVCTFVSVDDLQTLNGGTAITEADVITVTWVVESITGFTGANNNVGIETGISADPAFRSNDNLSTIARFRGDGTLQNSNRVGFTFGTIFTGGTGQTENEPTVEASEATGAEAVGLEATALSFEDGFTVVQTISVDGVSTQYSDIVVTSQTGTETGGTVLTTVLEPFPDDFDYLTFVNGAHFSVGASIVLEDGGVVTFTTAQLAISDGVTGTPLLGDIDMNGAVNFLDITPFITILASAGFQFEADIDGNGVVNFLDITPFISILATQ